jgi:hypothetical protein
VAAKNNPFSMARKPITCGIALERTIIIMNDSSTQARAMPSVGFGNGRGELRDRQRQVEGQDHQDDADEHRGRDVDERLDVPATSSRSMTRCSSRGITMTLSESVSPADQQRWSWIVR